MQSKMSIRGLLGISMAECTRLEPCYRQCNNDPHRQLNFDPLVFKLAVFQAAYVNSGDGSDHTGVKKTGAIY